MDAIQAWWSKLQELGPRYGYHPKACKTWLIVKPEYEARAKELFPELSYLVEGSTTHTITTTGRKYLGSFIGTDEGKQIFVETLRSRWRIGSVILKT